MAIVATVAVLFPACRKINEFTEVGGDIIPAIDNITTFDTSLSVQVFNDTFGLATDSTRLTTSDVHFLGLIGPGSNADPIFGQTDARIFMELKPEFFGTYPFARKDSLKLDSVVLVLSYVERYGDSTVGQNVRVYELNQAFKSDSTYLIRKEPFTYNTLLNDPTSPLPFIFPSKLDDSVKAFRDTTAGQLRIKLDTGLTLGRRLMNYDTSTAYKTDSAFRSRFKGFAIRSEGTGKAIMGFDMNNSKLAFYYKVPKKSGTFDSLAVTYFTFHTGCNSANYMKRDYTGTPVAAAAGSPIPATYGYIQKTPGTFANIKIPGLNGLSNRVVHRAELIVEQVWDPSDAIFPPPANLFLDAFDPTITNSYKFRTLPYSLDLSSTSGFDFTSFGVIPVNATDGVGNPIKIWKFNMSRYVQHIVTGTQTSYDLRLYAPLTIRGKTKVVGGGATDFDIFAGAYVNGSIGSGRVRVGGGIHPTQRMRLRIIYSKL
ncbi:MAG TPA: DUF4270 family protein [Chitinophagaceae bacterium]|nr:DUF4270 family protein [Chitinophagaceae bacterium]